MGDRRESAKRLQMAAASAHHRPAAAAASSEPPASITRTSPGERVRSTSQNKSAQFVQLATLTVTGRRRRRCEKVANRSRGSPIESRLIDFSAFRGRARRRTPRRAGAPAAATGSSPISYLAAHKSLDDLLSAPTSGRRRPLQERQGKFSGFVFISFVRARLNSLSLRRSRRVFLSS